MRHEPRFEPEPEPTWDPVWEIIGQGMIPPDKPKDEDEQ
jgi:hypothetical protein